jgi:hypothetical protein
LANIHSDFYLIHDQAAALFLLVGSNKALLFGTGSGRPGLSEFVKKFAGSKPVEVVVSSDDSEQIGGLAQFAANKIYLPKGSKITHITMAITSAKTH